MPTVTVSSNTLQEMRQAYYEVIRNIEGPIFAHIESSEPLGKYPDPLGKIARGRELYTELKRAEAEFNKPELEALDRDAGSGSGL